MTVVKLPQVMIDAAIDEVFGDYDERGSIATRVVAFLDGGKKQSIELSCSGGLSELDAISSEAKKAAEAIGAKQWSVIAPVSELGKELIFVSTENTSHNTSWKTLCVLMIHRKTGLSLDDIMLVTDIKSEGDEFSFCTPSEWSGPTCGIDIILTAKLFKWPIKKHVQKDVGREASDTVSDSKSDK
jgi:hypothetical protein